MTKGYSVHIGLNSVNASSYDGWPGTLRACENDARDMAAIASALGYQPTILLTKAATARRVIAAITKAAAAMQAGDIFWLTYSGHGGQVPDRNGDEATADAGEIGETADRYDETWVLYDRMLVDDELWALWALFPAKSRIVLLSDSCHSGTVSRAPLVPSRKPAVASRRMPMDVEERTYAAHKRTYDRIQRSVPPREAAAVGATILLVSGCQDNQESLDGRVNGLFTEHLLSAWDNGAFTGSLKRMRDVVSKRMPPTQTPNYYVVGPANRSFLSSRALSI
jgi:hypothetical protein